MLDCDSDPTLCRENRLRVRNCMRAVASHAVVASARPGRHDEAPTRRPFGLADENSVVR
jgi:hypothetical protein